MSVSISEDQKNRLIRSGRVLLKAIEDQGCGNGHIVLNYKFVQSLKSELASLEDADTGDAELKDLIADTAKLAGELATKPTEAVPEIRNPYQAAQLLQKAIASDGQYQRALAYLEASLLQAEEREEGLLEEIDQLKNRLVQLVMSPENEKRLDEHLGRRMATDGRMLEKMAEGLSSSADDDITNATCGDCWFWRVLGGESSAQDRKVKHPCKRYPPTPVSAPDSDGNVEFLKLYSFTSACGEFRRQP